MLLFSKEKNRALAEQFAHGDIRGRSLWRNALERFWVNKAAVTSLILIILLILFSFLGQLFSVWDHETIDWSLLGNIAEQGKPSFENGHYFGTDELGRDLYSRVLQGSQISLLVGILGAIVSVVCGTLYGAISGYIGGKIDELMMRIVDIILAIPTMLFLILMLVILGRSVAILFIGIGLISWPNMARIVRGQTLSLKHKEFVESARACGVGTLMIILRHIIPNLMGIVVVYATLLIPEMILIESFISFLGLGVQEPLTSWGALISQGASTMQYGTLWQLLFPLSFFVIAIFSFFFIGDGIRDAIDPKDR